MTWIPAKVSQLRFRTASQNIGHGITRFLNVVVGSSRKMCAWERIQNVSLSPVRWTYVFVNENLGVLLSRTWTHDPNRIAETFPHII